MINNTPDMQYVYQNQNPLQIYVDCSLDRNKMFTILKFEWTEVWSQSIINEEELHKKLNQIVRIRIDGMDGLCNERGKKTCYFVNITPKHKLMTLQNNLLIYQTKWQFDYDDRCAPFHVTTGQINYVIVKINKNIDGTENEEIIDFSRKGYYLMEIEYNPTRYLDKGQSQASSLNNSLIEYSQQHY